jgi:hypothetical protein
MGGDTDDSAHSSPSVEPSSELTLALIDFCGDGYDSLATLLQVIHKERLISDPMLQTLLFVGLGGYIHFFSTHFNETSMVEESHIHAVGMVMKNPRVGNLVEQMMSQTIASKISEVVE